MLLPWPMDRPVVLPCLISIEQDSSITQVNSLGVIVMVRAQSRSFQRTIKGWLQRSLQWWPPHHCSVPPLPPATFVGLISELRWNTSPTPIPPTKPAFLSLSLPTSTMCFLPQHNQSPTMLHTGVGICRSNHVRSHRIASAWQIGYWQIAE